MSQEKRAACPPLSALLREGIAHHELCRDSLYCYQGNGRGQIIKATHPLGAIAIGYRVLFRGEQAPFRASFFTDQIIIRGLRENVCDIDEFHMAHPLFPISVFRGIGSIKTIIIDMIDNGWTREEIASWLEAVGL